MFQFNVKMLGGYEPEFEPGAAGFILRAPEPLALPTDVTTQIRLGFASTYPEPWTCLLLPDPGLAGLGIINVSGMHEANDAREWCIALYNAGSAVYCIDKGDRIGIAVFVQRVEPNVRPVSSL